MLQSAARWLPVSLFIAVTFSGFTASANSGATWQDSLTEALTQELQQSGAPSLQVSVGYKDRIVFSQAVGLADISHQVAASPQTLYRTASISKWFTAAAAMQLAESGQLDLDKDISEYCPQFPQKAWPITTRDLLTHQSGIRHYADYASQLEQASGEEKMEVEFRRMRSELGRYQRFDNRTSPLQSFKDDPLQFEPGQEWRYSSFGYRVLGCVLEGASEGDYNTLLQTTLFATAGMQSTQADDAWAIVPHRAAGYRLDREKQLRQADLRDVSENLPAGGHLSTADDLVRFAQAFFSQQLVSEQSMLHMTAAGNSGSDLKRDRSWRDAIPSEQQYGYGIMRFPGPDYTWLGHTGRQAGGSAIIVSIPEKQLSVAIMTNVKGWNGYISFSDKLMQVLLASDLDAALLAKR